MQRPRIRLEIRGIMAAVAVSALVVGVYRIDAAPSVSIVLILGSTSVMAYKRYSDVLAQRVHAGHATARVQKIKLFLTSVIVAVTIIGLSDAAFLVGYYGFGEVLIPRSFGHQTANIHTPDVHDLLMGGFCGFIMAMIVAYALRRMIWPIEDATLPPAISPPRESSSSQ